MFRAATSSITITPTEPMWLAGFAVRTAPSRGKINDLFAKAVAIEDETGKRIVIVSADLIAISRDVALRVASEAKKRFGLNRDELLLCTTHTHYGPELRPDKVPFFHIPPEFARKIQPFADHLTNTFIDLIGTTLRKMQPAKLSQSQSSTDFATNRRPGEDPIDHDVPILQITDASGEPIAILFGYACHNTTMPPEDCLISGDWAGFACEQLQSKFPGAIAMFIAGAGADQNPHPKGPVQISQQLGTKLANAVLAGLQNEGFDKRGVGASPTQNSEHNRGRGAHATKDSKGTNPTPIDGNIITHFEEVPLEYQPLPSRESLQADLKSDDQPRRTKAEFLLEKLDRNEKFDPSYPCPIQTIRIGDNFLSIAIGGEPVIDYAVNLKREFAATGKLIWIAGYANDMFGYVATPRVLAGGGYEGTRSVLWSALQMPFTESVEDRVLSGIRNQLRKN